MLKFTKDQGFFFAVLVFIFIILAFISPTIKKGMQPPDYYQQLFHEGKIVDITKEQLEADPIIPGLFIGKQDVIIEILDGPYKGNTYESQNLLSRSHNVLCKKNLTIIVGIRETEEGPRIWVYNHKRSPVIYVLAGIFFLLLLLLGKKNGLRSILSLVFTGVMILFIMIPLIFRGYNPSLVAIGTAMITILISFILIGGYSKKTLAAIIGTWAGVLLAGLLSYTAAKFAHVTGVHMDKGEQLVYIATDYKIQVRGLMFASILIASLGAVMDVAMSMASSITEIHQTDKSLGFYDLVKSGMNVGRDVMGTMANTLILAFAGGSLSLMLLIWGYQMSFTQLINMPFMSIQIIQGLAGSIGIILAVPFTTIVTAYLLKGDRFRRRECLSSPDR